jgi:hypothetical protein
MRHPIWSCSVRGFACHRRYRRRGALLPHLFTLTRLRTPPFGRCASRGKLPRRACLAVARGSKSRERGRAVYFLCHYPSSCPARALPGALPFGVRTFLPPPPFGPQRGKLVSLPAEAPGTKTGDRLADCDGSIIAYAFQSAACGAGLDSSPGRRLQTVGNSYPSISCLIPYCSSFL